jgi:aminotransferase MxcL
MSSVPSVSEPGVLSLQASERLLVQARERIAGVTSSMMKRPEQFCPGRFPAYLARGMGARAVDVDGNEYIDFICGLGATSLGHGHPEVVGAIRSELERGFLHSLPVALEVEATDALLTSISLTGRHSIVTIGYNGWHDHFMYDTPGVPQAVAALTTRMPLFAEADEPKVLERVRANGQDLAAVVLSVPYGRRLAPQFLGELRQACSAAGALLIFDEIVTGFRLGPGGAHVLYGVEADLACYSKALAAGLPLSALVGPRKHMEAMQKLQVSTTFGGETLSLAACKAALRAYQTTNYYTDISRLGQALRTGINQVSKSVGATLEVIGYDQIPLFSFSPVPETHIRLMTEFQGKMAERGVLLRRDVNFICGAHTDEQIEHTVRAAKESLVSMRHAGAFS